MPALQNALDSERGLSPAANLDPICGIVVDLCQDQYSRADVIADDDRVSPPVKLTCLARDRFFLLIKLVTGIVDLDHSRSSVELHLGSARSREGMDVQAHHDPRRRLSAVT